MDKDCTHQNRTRLMKVKETGLGLCVDCNSLIAHTTGQSEKMVGKISDTDCIVKLFQELDDIFLAYYEANWGDDL